MTKATISSGYRWRLGIVALAMLIFGAYFVYDGWIGYPHKQKIQLAYQQVVQNNQDNPPAIQRKWQAMAASHGWPQDTPTAPISDMSIYTQWICAGITLPIGLFFGIGFMRTGWRWIGADEDGLHNHKGLHIPWEAIRSVDDARWDRKGIAIVNYEKDGKSGRLVLDDWKFQRQPIDEIHERVAAAIGARV